MPNLPEYSESSEFFTRELDLYGRKINHEIDEPLPEDSLIYCNDLIHWERRLKLSKKSSVSVVVGSNEYYDLTKLSLLNGLESIKCAFIQYLPNGERFRIQSLLSFVSRMPKVLFQRDFYGTVKLGLKNYNRVKSNSFDIPVYNFPLGYTERFALELRELGLLQGTESLFFGGHLSNFSDRQSLSFLGQKGSWFRRLMVDFFQSQPNFKKETYSSFGGFTNLPQSTEYSRSILQSRFVVCPPGNCSSQSFRYYEAIALGAIPVLAETSIQDWNTFDYWPDTKPWKKTDFVQVWESLSSLSQVELEALSLELRMYVLNQISVTRELLNSCLKSK